MDIQTPSAFGPLPAAAPQPIVERMTPGETDEGRPAPDVVRTLVEHHRQFLGFLERRVGSRALAEDLLQDAFVRGIGKLDALRSDESAVAWFYRVLRNTLIDHRRRSGAAERKLAAFERELASPPEHEAELHSEICRCVSDLASTLKREYAEALRAVELEGVPVKDFAEREGISASNAGVRLFRAREALRKQVARACGTCAEHGCQSCSCKPGSCAPAPQG